MIRIAHCADIHLGMENYGRIDEATGLSSRVTDFLTCWDRLIDIALDEGIDAFVFAGDAFRTRDPNPTYQREFQRRITRLAIDHGIPCVLIPGNHDLPVAEGKASAIESFATLRVPNVYVSQRPDVLTVPTKRGPCQFVTLPWVTPHRFLFEEWKGLSLAAIGERINLKLLDLFARFAERRLDPSLPAVLVAHNTFQHAQYGSERDLFIGHDWVLPVRLFQTFPYSYGALGHVHRHQQICDDPPVVYSGSISRINFNEEHEPKGFVLADLEAGKPARWRFVELPARRFVTLIRDLRDVAADALTGALLRSLESDADRVRDAVVRLKVLLREDRPEAIADLQVRRFVEGTLGASYFTGIVRQIEEPPARRRLGSGSGAIETMRPLDVFRAYLAGRQISGDQAEPYLAAVRDLLRDLAEEELAETGIADVTAEVATEEVRG